MRIITQDAPKVQEYNAIPMSSNGIVTELEQPDSQLRLIQALAEALPPGQKLDLVLGLIADLPPTHQRKIAKVLGLEVAAGSQSVGSGHQRPENRRNHNCGWLNTWTDEKGRSRFAYRWYEGQRSDRKTRKQTLKTASEYYLVDGLIKRRVPCTSILQALLDFRGNPEVTLDRLHAAGLLTTQDLEVVLGA